MSVVTPAPAPPDPAARPLPATVVLIGLMGAGKSCIGRHLARRLGVPFVDADHEIEEAAGCSVADIFAYYGEAGFRDGERRVMARLLAQPPCILAAGGGAYMEPRTRELIAEKAVSLWLEADLDLLVGRTRGRTHRPLLNQGDPRETLRRLIEVRYPVYARCDVRVTTSDEPPGRTTRRVLAALEAHFGHPLTVAEP